MPNDVPDWTAQHQVQLIATNGQLIGDVGPQLAQADSVTEQIVVGVLPTAVALVIVSFLPAGGQTIAAPAAGANLVTGTNTSVTPTFNSSTVAGHLLVAQVSSSGGKPNTSAPGWMEAQSQSSGNEWAAVWFKPNCGNGEAAPTFTSAGGTAPMFAALSEISGAATSSPVDVTGSTSAGPGTASLTATTSRTDNAIGDLVVTASRWQLSSAAAPTFVQAFNNATALLVTEQNTGATSQVHHSVFALASVPASKVVLPLGVSNWAYDSVGSSQPATGSQASVVLAATTGKTYTAAMLAASLSQISGAASAPTADLLDGASVIFSRAMGVTTSVGDKDDFSFSGLALKGTSGNSMTFRVSVGAAGVLERTNIGAYLR